MAKSKKIIIFVIAILVILLFSVMLINVSQPLNIYMFSDISECGKLETMKEATVSRYSEATQDMYLKELVFEASYCAEYVSDELAFEIFAYKFSSADLSREYFYNVTQRDMDLNLNFLTNQGSFYYTIIVINGDSAYRIKTSSSNQEVMDNFLSTVFSLKFDVHNTQFVPNEID